MTNDDSAQHQATTPEPGPPRHYVPPPQQEPEKNTLGTVAFVTSIVGFIFACVPGALIIGWILLPIAFVLALVAVASRGKKKGLGIAGLIISIVGTVVGFAVFIAVIDDAFSEAFSGDETTASTPDGESGEGTRENPYPLGTVVSSGDWAVTIHEVNFDATEAVASENQFNDPASEGRVFILVDVTIEYIGDDSSGDSPSPSFKYVTVDGNTIGEHDDDTIMNVTPGALDRMSTMYHGASTTGNILLSVPADSAREGVLAVEPDTFSDTVFVAVQ